MKSLINWKAVPRWVLVSIAVFAGTATLGWAGWVTTCAIKTLTLDQKVDYLKTGMDKLLDVHIGKENRKRLEK